MRDKIKWKLKQEYLYNYELFNEHLKEIMTIKLDKPISYYDDLLKQNKISLKKWKELTKFYERHEPLIVISTEPTKIKKLYGEETWNKIINKYSFFYEPA